MMYIPVLAQVEEILYSNADDGFRINADNFIQLLRLEH